MELSEGRVTVNDVELAYLEAGPADGPLALCLHGFPDSAWTWRLLAPELVDAGFRVVAPFLRGYAPSAVPADGRFQAGVLSSDALALHSALGGDGSAVLIGHDWGALAAYGAASGGPGRWRRIVAAAVPPALGMEALFSYEQVKRSFYIFVFQWPLAEMIVGADDGCMAVSVTEGTAEQLSAGSRLEIVPGAGHFLHLERPDVVNRAIVDFLAAD